MLRHLKPPILESVITSKGNDCTSNTRTGILSIHTPISSAVETYLLSVIHAMNTSLSCAIEQFYHVDKQFGFLEESFKTHKIRTKKAFAEVEIIFVFHEIRAVNILRLFSCAGFSIYVRSNAF